VVAPPQPPRETVQVKAVRPDRDALEIRFPRVEGYRVELAEERSRRVQRRLHLELTPDLVGPPITRNEGIIGEGVRPEPPRAPGRRAPSTLLFHLTKHLLYTKWRDPGEEPKLHLFGQLKRITKQWLDTCLVCKGGTYPAQLMYQELADMACERITAGITAAAMGTRPIKALLDPYNPTGSTAHVRFNTSRTDAGRRAPTAATSTGWSSTATGRPSSAASPRRTPRSRLREEPQPRASRCRTATARRCASTARTSSCWSTTAAATDDLLHLVVEIKGYRARTRRRRSPRWRPTGCPA
jgi:type III restriction enzyme